MLYGPGGSGKSTCLRGAKAALLGCTGLLPDNILLASGKFNGDNADKIASVIISSRMVVCFELDLAKGSVNMSVLKNVAGGDYVKIGDNMTKALTSMMIATNGLPDHEIQPEFSSDALMRRLICIEMKVDTSSLDAVEDPNGEIPRLNLLCNSIVVRLMYSYIQVRPMDVLLTLCGTKYHYARDYIAESLDGVITEGEGRGAMFPGCVTEL
jgi:hypothetical protein